MLEKKILGHKFFNRPAPIVAKDLLGKFLVRKLGKGEIALMITETEAYDGFRDKGSHANRGETRRNWPMFGPPGYWYVYFTYGMHWMLNIVTCKKGYPAAVLIRGAEGVNGPGRLTKLLRIDGKLNAKPASKASGLWIAASNPLKRASSGDGAGRRRIKFVIKKGPRIGIDYAGPYWAKRHLRFWIKR